MLEYITLPDNLLPPPSPYSHAVRAGDFLFVTGQLAEDPVTGEINRGSIPEQTRQVMENLKLVLSYANASFDTVVMARLFLTDFRDFQAVNQVFSSYFTDERRPGRTTIGAIALAGQGDVEIDLIIYCGS
jgi:2-iminobutanoate/2-iminopropanoate deaminase